MINADKFKGTKGEYDRLARIVNQINQRVRVLERMGYEVSGVSQNAEVYNDPDKLKKLFKKYEQIMSPDYQEEIHLRTLMQMQENLKRIFGEEIKVDLTPQQL